MMSSGNGGRALQSGRDVIEMHPGAFGIVACVLAIILWGLIVAALVLGIVTMGRRLRHPGMTTAVETRPGAATTYVPLADPTVESPAPIAPAIAGQVEVAGSATTALQILNDRFARGEIGQEEYLDRRKTITGS